MDILGNILTEILSNNHVSKEKLSEKDIEECKEEIKKALQSVHPELPQSSFYSALATMVLDPDFIDEDELRGKV